jgi:hypothetical protein
LEMTFMNRLLQHMSAFFTGGVGGESGKARPDWILVALQGFEPRTCGL